MRVAHGCLEEAYGGDGGIMRVCEWGGLLHVAMAGGVGRL